jgi:hypothetical protein
MCSGRKKRRRKKLFGNVLNIRKTNVDVSFFSQFLQKNVGIQNFHLLCRIRYHIDQLITLLADVIAESIKDARCTLTELLKKNNIFLNVKEMS